MKDMYAVKCLYQSKFYSMDNRVLNEVIENLDTVCVSVNTCYREFCEYLLPWKECPAGGYNNQGGGGYNGYSARNGRYQHYGPDIERFYEKLDRMMECVEEYFMGKNRYHDGAHPGHMVEGLEKTMYAVCTLVESLMDTAETPEEKETIRKHIEKIKNL